MSGRTDHPLIGLRCFSAHLLSRLEDFDSASVKLFPSHRITLFLAFHSLAIGLCDVFGQKANVKKAREATATDNTNIVANGAPNDIPFGLNV
jgi:hypothetical protein